MESDSSSTAALLLLDAASARAHLVALRQDVLCERQELHEQLGRLQQDLEEKQVRGVDGAVIACWQLCVMAMRSVAACSRLLLNPVH